MKIAKIRSVKRGELKMNFNDNLSRRKCQAFLKRLNNLNQNRGYFGLFSMRGDGKGPRINRYAKKPNDFYGGLTNDRHYWMTPNILGSKHRCDANISLLIANFIDVDTLENGVNPEAFIKKVLNTTKASALVPTVIQSSGHGSYLIYLYKEAIPATTETINTWRETETGLVNGLDKLTRRWFGKSLADPKSTNPSRLLRMPETWNVKYLSNDNDYTKPVRSRIIKISNKRYLLNGLYDAVKDFIPNAKSLSEKHHTSNSHPISKGEIEIINRFLNSKMGTLIDGIAKSKDSLLVLEKIISRLKSPWLKCVLNKILTGFHKGTRNSSTLSLASQLLITDCNAKSMTKLVTIANDNSQPPMSTTELESVIKQALKYRLESINLLRRADINA